jgi:hypothetical protein
VPFRDQGRSRAPVEHEVRDERCDGEWSGERNDPNAERGSEASTHVCGIDLHSRKKREHDRPELGDEVEPVLGLEMEDIPGSDSERQLEQRDRHAELDRDDAGDEHDSGENCCELDWAHGGLLGVRYDVR